MHLEQHKKGLEFTTLISIILLLVGAGLLIYVFAVKTSQLDTETAELLCRGFNAIHEKAKVGIPILPDVKAPRACNTIHKIGNDGIPSKKYLKLAGDNPTLAVKYEMRDLMARCWWMWLEGREPDMFGRDPYQLWRGDPGFTCYTFTIKENVNRKKPHEFSLVEFVEDLKTPYYALDSSEKCNPAGGGYCTPDCITHKDNADVLVKEFPSERCAENTKCCVVKKPEFECVDKGGRCEQECSKIGDGKGATYLNYPLWKCPGDTAEGGKRCCIDSRNMVSYLDYIQGTNGADTGPGAVSHIPPKAAPNALSPEFTFKSGQRYAISFVSPGEYFSSDNPKEFLKGLVPILGVLSGKIYDFNHIVFSNYGDVKGKFAESTIDAEGGGVYGGGGGGASGSS